MSQYHGFSCNQALRLATIRHDEVTKLLKEFIRKVVPADALLLDPQPIINLALIPGQPQCTADLGLFMGNNPPMYFDTAICSPCRPDFLGRVDNDNNPVIGTASTYRQNQKLSHYRRSYGLAIVPFLKPFVLESSGRLGSSAISIIDKLSGFSDVVQVANKDIKIARKAFYSKVNILIMKFAARLIEKSRLIVRLV